MVWGGACGCVDQTLGRGRTWGGRGLSRLGAEFAGARAGPVADTGTSAGESRANQGFRSR